MGWRGRLGMVGKGEKWEICGFGWRTGHALLLQHPCLFAHAPTGLGGRGLGGLGDLGGLGWVRILNHIGRLGRMGKMGNFGVFMVVSF